MQTTNKFLEGLKKLVIANHSLIALDEDIAALKYEPTKKQLQNSLAKITIIEAEFAAFKALIVESINA